MRKRKNEYNVSNDDQNTFSILPDKQVDNTDKMTSKERCQYYSGKLRSCPFCGSNRVFVEPVYLNNIGLTFHHVKCDQCKAQTGLKQGVEVAVDAWNNRNEAR